MFHFLLLKKQIEIRFLPTVEMTTMFGQGLGRGKVDAKRPLFPSQSPRQGLCHFDGSASWRRLRNLFYDKVLLKKWNEKYKTRFNTPPESLFALFVLTVILQDEGYEFEIFRRKNVLFCEQLNRQKTIKFVQANNILISLEWLISDDFIGNPKQKANIIKL